MYQVSPGELVSHVLREEPVGHSSAVNNLCPNHFVYQHCNHLQCSNDTVHVNQLFTCSVKTLAMTIKHHRPETQIV